MTPAQIIRQHYGLNRPVTPAEVEAEVSNLLRKWHKGNLDDSQGHLAAALDVFLAPVRGTL